MSCNIVCNFLLITILNCLNSYYYIKELCSNSPYFYYLSTDNGLVSQMEAVPSPVMFLAVSRHILVVVARMAISSLAMKIVKLLRFDAPFKDSLRPQSLNF